MPIVKVCKAYHVVDTELVMREATSIGRQYEHYGKEFVPESLWAAIRVLRSFGGKHLTLYGITPLDDVQVTEYE